MNIYIYAADVYCEACGKDIRKRLRKEGLSPQNPKDEHTYNSGEYPKGPYDSDDESSDSPQHCGSSHECLEPTIINGKKYGKFLETPLTMEGYRYLREEHSNDPSPVTKFWIDFYGDEVYGT